jgi:hypothetical protein
LIDKRAYSRKIAELVRQQRDLEKDTLRRMIMLLREMRAQIAADLLDAGSFDAYRLQQLSGNLGRLTADLERDLGRALGLGVQDAYSLGGRSVIEPLQAAGFRAVYYQPSQTQVGILMDYSADLVRGLTGNMLASLNTQLRLAALGQRTPFDAMQELTRILGTNGRSEFGGVAYRAERIIRTDLQRAYNIASHTQQQQAAETIPGLLKRWLHSGNSVHPRQDHIRIHYETLANPIPVGQAYSNGMMYPLDPAGSAKDTINCGCRQVTLHPEIGVIRGPLDKKIEEIIDGPEDK